MCGMVCSLMNLVARLHLLPGGGVGEGDLFNLGLSHWLTVQVVAKSTGAMVTSCVGLKSDRILIPHGSPGSISDELGLQLICLFYLILLAVDQIKKTKLFSDAEKKTCRSDGGLCVAPDWSQCHLND